MSIATVSRVVNGSQKVSEKTRQKVMDVIKAEGYTPNIFARGLGLDSMKTIGIMCPNIADNYMARAISHLEQNFHEYGYDINNYRLLSSYPVLNKILKKQHLLLSSMCLWNMFNSYEYKSSAGYYEEDTLGQLSLGFLPKVVSDLKSNNMFLFKEGDTRVYKSDTGDVTVEVLVEDSIKLVYSDVYSCSYESEIAEEVGIDIVKNPILLSRIIESGKGYCIFKYSTMNFEELLRQLRLYKYKFVLFGFCGIRLLETCCMVCGFRRGSDYVYVSFYYNENGREFLIKVETKSTELQKIKINNASVTLIKVSVDSMDSVSTLINGFDLENFKENNLV